MVNDGLFTPELSNLLLQLLHQGILLGQAVLQLALGCSILLGLGNTHAGGRIVVLWG